MKNESTQTELRLLHSIIISSAHFLGLVLVLAALSLVIHLEISLISISESVSEISLGKYLQEGYFIITNVFMQLFK